MFHPRLDKSYKDYDTVLKATYEEHIGVFNEQQWSHWDTDLLGVQGKIVITRQQVYMFPYTK